MKKLIALILNFGIILLSSSHEVYATKGYGRGYRKGRGNVENNNAQHVQKQTVENNSNHPQSQQSADMSDVEVVSDVQVVEVLANSVEKLEIGDHQLFADQQNRQQDCVDSSLSDDVNRFDQEANIIAIKEPSGNLDEEVLLSSELKKSQDQMAIIESGVLQNESAQKEISSGYEVQVSGELEETLPVELERRMSEDSYTEEKQEITIEEELIDASVDCGAQDQVGKLFEVVFKNNQEKDVFAQCNNYQFCEFMLNALGRMTEPETVSMVRHYGFGLGHVPLLLVWSSHLFDRVERSRVYCMETQDLRDVLMLMLMIDLRAQVDASCIEHMKKNSHSRSALAVQTDNKIIEKSTACAPHTAGYLKRKLATLWRTKIQEMYEKKKLPCYATILQKVKDIAHQWQDDQLQSPIWVCCVMHQPYMLLGNLLAGWPAEKLGNWWNPQQSLITVCQGYDYSEIRKPKTDEVLAQLEEYASWPEYFGDIYALAKVDDAEYDSDGSF